MIVAGKKAGVRGATRSANAPSAVVVRGSGGGGGSVRRSIMS